MRRCNGVFAVPAPCSNVAMVPIWVFIPVPVTTPARTVADCFKHRSQIGLEACLEALRDLLARDRNVMPELTRHARMNRVLRLMQPYLEAMA